MKNTVILSVVMSTLIGTSSTFAYNENREDGFREATTSVGLQNSDSKLTDAIRKRQWFYFKNKVRNGSYKNRVNQKTRHQAGKASINVNEQSTRISRAGALKDVPFYSMRRQKDTKSYLRPTSKQVFRARAINYYVDGGNANKEDISDGVVYGSTHKVRRIPVRAKKSEVGAITSSIRNVQREISKSEQVPAGYQKTSFRRGTSTRNFMHPFMSME